MKKTVNSAILFLAIGLGSIIGKVKGEEAKQKWVFKVRSHYDNKRLIAQRRMLARQGGVLLDDIEMASYH